MHIFVPSTNPQHWITGVHHHHAKINYTPFYLTINNRPDLRISLKIEVIVRVMSTIVTIISHGQPLNNVIFV